MRLAGSPKLTVERVVTWIEHQVAETLAVYQRLGSSEAELVEFGRKRMKGRHRALLAAGGVNRASP